MSVVTSVPALALNAVLGRRMAPMRFARSARYCRIVNWAVHRVAAGNQGHDAARAQLVQGLGEEIVVNRARQGRLAAISGIEDRIVAERDVADGGIEEIVGERSVLEAFGEDR